ncbi:MAG: rod-binding protein [Nitrospirota bacterium]|nr:rod-binding protein [Nitrospirota bacterium]
MDRLPLIGNRPFAEVKNGQAAADHVKNADNKNLDQKINNVAQDMESLFAYQLIKTMRETSKNFDTEDKEIGYDTYMDMFDTEISKLLSKRGLGLQNVLTEQLGRMTDQFDPEKVKSEASKEISSK